MTSENMAPTETAPSSGVNTAQNRLQAAYLWAQSTLSTGGMVTTANQQFEDDYRTSSVRSYQDDVLQERRAAQQEFDAAVAAIRKLHSDFLHPQIAFKQIAGAASVRCATWARAD